MLTLYNNNSNINNNQDDIYSTVIMTLCLSVVQYATIIVVIILLEIAGAILAGVFHSEVMSHLLLSLHIFIGYFVREFLQSGSLCSIFLVFLYSMWVVYHTEVWPGKHGKGL